MQISPEDLQAIHEINPGLALSIAGKLVAKAGLENEPPYVDALFYPQRKFYEDPAKKKAAVCSRRAGKTEGVAAWLLDGARDCPDGLSVYIALSRNNCRLILWATLLAINERHGLKLWFREQDNQLIIQTPNGHRIWLAGCKDSAEIEKFRGIKLRRAAIDEGASYGAYLKPLVFDVLEPALLDLDGELCIIGTPGVIPTGLFFEVTTGKGAHGGAARQWSTHSWTCLQNPYIQLGQLNEKQRAAEIQRAQLPGYLNDRAAKWLRDKCEANGWDETHPTYQREWLGIWVRDEGALVYPYDASKNSFQRLPEGVYSYVLAVDVGYEDSTAFVVAAYRKGHPEIYIVHASKREHLIPSAVAAQIERIRKEYGCYRVIMDVGGLGKGYAEEASQRYGIYCEPAEKTKKRAFIEIIRGELLSGTIRIHPTKAACLLQEMVTLVWDEDHLMPDSRFEDHATDAFLYACRAVLANYRPKYDYGLMTQQEIDAQFMSEQRQAALREVMRRNRLKVQRGSVFADIASGKR